MRGNVPSYEARNPRTFIEALELIREEPRKWRPLAGGTDLMVLLETAGLRDYRLLNLLALPELKGISTKNGKLRIGATVTFTEIQRDANVRKHFPLLCAAASQIGAIAIQNRATIGGNIANASPAADAPPALMVYDAEIELASASGTGENARLSVRTIPYRDFHTGYKKLTMHDDELISAILLPIPDPSRAEASRQYYRKVGTRKAQAISKVCLAAIAEVDARGLIRSARVAVGSVAPTVVRCLKTEAVLAGKKPSEASTAARAALKDEISPIDDIRSTRDYRAQVTENLLDEFLSAF